MQTYERTSTANLHQLGGNKKNELLLYFRPHSVMTPIIGKIAMYSERGSSDPKNISVNDRIKQFPGESLCLRNGKLFCDACKELLSSKKAYFKIMLPPESTT